MTRAPSTSTRLLTATLVVVFATLSLLGRVVAQEPHYDESDSGVVRRQLARLHIDAGIVGQYDLDAMHRARLVLRAVDDDEWRGHTIGIGAITAGAMGLVLMLVVAPSVEGGCSVDRCPDAAAALSVTGALIGVVGLVLVGVAIAEILHSHDRLARWADAILDGTFPDAAW